jgi:hypothetical protein
MNKRIFKTAKGLEIKEGISVNDSEITYYYAWYTYRTSDKKWKVISNKHLWGEPILEIDCTNKEESMKIAQAINRFLFHLTIDGQEG